MSLAVTGDCVQELELKLEMQEPQQRRLGISLSVLLKRRKKGERGRSLKISAAWEERLVWLRMAGLGQSVVLVSYSVRTCPGLLPETVELEPVGSAGTVELALVGSAGTLELEPFGSAGTVELKPVGSAGTVEL